MRALRGLMARIAGIFRRRQLDRRLDEELRFHLEMQARELEAGGLGPEEARRAARLALAPGGSTSPLVEAYRAQGGVPALETLAQDLRYAARMLRKSPGFTAVALLSLAFGTGTNCAIFSVVDALLLKPLPVPNANRLVVLRKHGLSGGDDPPPWFSYSAYRHLAEAGSAISGLLAFTYEFTVLARPEAGGASGLATSAAAGAAAPGVETATAQLVSGNFFSLLGASAAAGRTFSAAEDVEPGAHPLAVLSHSFWRRRFGRDPRVVGRVLRIDGAAVTVVGVAPRGFTGVIADVAPDVWLPLTARDLIKYRDDSYTDGPADAEAPVWQQVNYHWLRLVAIRRPKVSAQQASAVLNVLFEREKQAQAATNTDPRGRAEVLSTGLELAPAERGLAGSRGRLGSPLLILMSVAGVVLLIACVNVANLLLARADRRRREMAVRLGIGAGRGRLVRQLLTESLLLAALGGALGLLFAYWGSRFLLGLLASGDASLSLDVALDGRRLAFAAAIALATAVVFGLAPALHSTRLDLASSLKEGGRALAASALRGGGGWGRGRRLPLGRVLVAAQIGLAMLLLVGAGLFVRSLRNLIGVDAGFERDRVVLASVSPRLLGYDKPRLVALYQRLVERLERVPGVRSASLSAYSLLGDSASQSSVVLPGYTPRRGEEMWAMHNVVTPGYFETVGMPLVRGRGFTRQDRLDAPGVALVNETFVRRFLRRGEALGQRFGFGNPKRRRDLEVVGVVKDAKYLRLRESARPMVYTPVEQQPRDLYDVEVRVADGATPAVAGALRHVIAEVDPELPVFAVATMGEQVARSLAAERAVARLSGFFGGLALLLAVIGLYGVMSYDVSRRTGEIGLRMALGAPRGQVIGLVMREAARLTAAGVVAGLAASLALTRLAAGQLFGVQAHDPQTLLLAALAMAAVALAAGLLPARRAADTDPMAALRSE
jgi:predicted permease